ncbi:MMPL family transporter [Phycisphaera mikurensis]|uniref:SSD domain-containing protein n=1 Tax=Phycisphaera mikurensis (strain NBRC 102666 / KCTC 22515 / FYK2301M01) TaxID=1142394 RepID=I0IBT3_PHYMF|nr:MMPL family transporter [Phycisphaera mikurensis]MBB6442050.1 hypothetical protein [Phycisphaera mikurensis]BAM02721.1 hypothetical protein PSMK_05620 [Phycisphaera mikurensis NBRC 102666]
MRRWITLPERRPRATLGVAAVVLALAGLSVLRLEPDASMAPLIPEGVPAAEALRTLGDRFEVAERALVLVEAAEASPGDRRRELIAFGRRLGDAIERDPAAGPLTRSVVLEPGADAASWIREEVTPAALPYLDEEALAGLRARLSPEGLEARTRRVADLLGGGAPGAQAAVAAAVADPVGVSELLAASARRRGGRLDRGAFGGGPMISADGRALLVQLVPAGEPGDLDASAAFTAAVRAVIDRAVAADPAVGAARLFGGPPTAAYNAAAIRSDMTRSVTGSVLLLQGLFLLAYRRWLAFPLAAVPLAAGLLAGFGVYACFRGTLTPLTAAAGAVLAGLGVDFAIHRLGVDGGGLHGSGNRAVAGPMAAACGTSLLGFAAMGVSSVPAVRDFALVGALGLAGASVAALTLLPALLALTRRAGAPAARDGGARRLAAAVAARPRAAVAAGAAAGLAVLGAAAWPTGTERFAHDLDALNPRPNPPLEAQADAEKIFPAADATLPVIVEAADGASLRAADAAVAAAVREAAPVLTAAAGGPVGVGFTGLSSMLPAPTPPPGFAAAAEALRGVDLGAAAEAAGLAPGALDPAEAWLRLLPDAPAPDEAALRRHPLLASAVLPAGSADREGKRLALATVRWTLPPGADAGARGRVVDALGDAVDAVPGATATGLERGGRVIGERLGGELARMLAIAGVAVLAWLFACFRRVGTVLLVLVPPAAGVAAVLAAGNLAGVPLNLLSVLALPLLVGIGVDDGVFLVAHARRGGAEAAAALGNSLYAVTVTSVSTAAGFGSLLFTSTPAIRTLGGTLAAGVAACWLASVLVVLPLVLRGAAR